MLGFLLLSPFLVVFLPSCALEGPRQEQGGHFSTWAVTGQGQSGLCWESRAAVTWKRRWDFPLWSEGTRLTISSRTGSR